LVLFQSGSNVEINTDNVSKNMKYKYLILTGILILIIVVIVYLYKSIPDFKPKVKIVEINSSKLNEKLYLKKKNWGMTGDAQVIVVSGSPERDFEPNTNKEYVYEGFSPFFYNFNDDTLDLYVSYESKIPIELHTKIRINQIVLGSLELQRLDSNHSYQGLKKIE
jgi:hypothetical protein